MRVADHAICKCFAAVREAVAEGPGVQADDQLQASGDSADADALQFLAFIVCLRPCCDHTSCGCAAAVREAVVEGQGVQADDQPQASGNSVDAELNPEKSTGSSMGERERAVSEGLSEGNSVPEPRSRTKKLPAGSTHSTLMTYSYCGIID